MTGRRRTGCVDRSRPCWPAALPCAGPAIFCTSIRYAVAHGDTSPVRGDRPWVAGCSLAYRRSWWRQHPFPEVASGEDARFVQGLPIAPAVVVGDLVVAFVHPGNTSPKLSG
jgi:hypothetical protein